MNRRFILALPVAVLGICASGDAQVEPVLEPIAAPAATAPAVTPPVAPAAAPPSASAAPAAQPTLRFNFKGATWDQVLDYFSRSTGLPVVREVPAPDGVVDYLSPRAYALPEALQTLNILLQTRGIMLRHDGERLYLQKLEDMKRENIPTYVGRLPGEVTADQVVTIVVPLINAQAKPVAEQLAQLVAAYGSVTAMEKQNALVIVETAAQVRRLQNIINELDREDVENVVEFIPIRHAKAVDLVKSLTALVGERTVEYVINPQNNQRVKLEENRLAGLTIAADERTNAIIGRGTRAKLDQLKQTIELLDVPGQGEGRAIRGFTLNRLTPEAAAAQLTQLFNQSGKGDRKPMIIQQPELNRITVIGSDEAVAEAATLMVELDGVPMSTSTERTIAIVPLASAKPAAAIAAVNALLSRREAAAVSMQAGVDGASVLVAGPDAEVESVKAVLRAVDVPGRPDRQVRLLKVAAPNAGDLVAKAKSLYEAQSDAADAADDVEVEFDAKSGVVTLIGSNPALAQFASILDQARGVLTAETDVRVVKVQHVKPSAAAAFLEGLARQAAMDPDGAAAPTIEAVDDAKILVISALPRQHQVITQLLATLDVPAEHAVQPLRMFQLRIADAQNLSATLNATYGARPSEERAVRPVSVSADVQTNMLLVSAHPDVLPEIEAIVEQLNDANRADDQGREIRIFPLKVARAEALAKTIDDMFPEQPVPVDPRGRPRPELQKPREVVVRADPQTNALIVDAPIQRMSGFEKLVEQLDRQEIAADVEIRAYRIRHTDLASVAQAIQKLIDSGSLGAGAAGRAGVTVTAEPVTRSLVVSGPKEIFERVDEVLKTLDAKKEGPATVLRLFPLKNAKAETLAPMLREILAARLTEDVPDAGVDADSLLRVTADRKTNTLVISAPEAVMSAAEELLKQLDSGSAAVGDPVIRVHPLTFADAREVAQSLTQALPSMISKATGEPLNVRLIPSAGSNVLILVGPEADLNEVDPLIEPLDARPSQDAIDAKTFELKFADAARIAPIVQNLLTDQQETDPRIILERIRRSRGEQDTAPKVRVEADTRTNSLIVSGPQRTVALAQTLIAELDRADASSDRTFATFTPANADALSLIETTKRIVAATQPSGRRSTLELFAEAQTGAVVAIGAKDEVDQAVAMMKQRDAEAIATPQLDLAIVSLKAVEARAMAPILTALLQDRSRWPAKLQSAARAGFTVVQPSVTADVATNRLLVSAPAELMPIARDLLAQLDQAPTGAQALETKLITLQQARADDVAAAVRTALDARAAAAPGRPKATVASEPSGNALILTAPAELIREIEAIVAGLDRGVAPDQAQVRSIFLKHARADAVAPLVEQLLTEQELVDVQDLPNWARVEYLRAKQAAGTAPPVRVVADARLNAVIVSGPAAVLNTAEQMIAQLDVSGEQTAASRSVRILTVENADAADLATTIGQLFAEDEASTQPPTVRVNAASNSLIVRGSEEQFRTIEQIVKQIDKATIVSGRELRTIAVDPSKASAQELAQMLRKLLQSGDGAGSAVEVISIDELIERTGDAPAGSPQSSSTSIRPVPVRSIPAALRFLAMSALALPQEADESDAGVTIAVDEASNSLVIVGGDRAQARIAELVKQLQEQMPAAPGRIRYVALKPGQDAERLKNLATETMRQFVPPGGKPGDLLRRVSIVADVSGGGLVIAAGDADFKIVGSLIASLAGSPTPDRLVVKVYPLATITAERAASGLRSLVGADGRGNRSAQLREVAVTLLAQGQSIDAVIDPARLRITADAQNNSVVVMGDPESIAFMDKFVEMLDQSPVGSPNTLRLFTLRNAKAAELRSTLRDIFVARQRAIAPGSIQPEFSVDERTNTLLVTAAPEQLSEVESLLKQLDAGPTDDQRPLRVIQLAAAPAAEAAEILKQVVVGSDPARRASTTILAESSVGVLLVRAGDDVMAEIDSVLKEIDREAVSAFKVRTITLAKADAAVVAAALQKFYDDRARMATSGRNRREQGRRVSIIGDPGSSTLLIAASDDDFAEISTLVSQFDSVQATQSMTYRLFPLKNAKAADIENILQQLIDSLMWSDSGSMFGFFGSPQPSSRGKDAIAVRAEPRTNTIVVTGRGDRFDMVEQMIDVLDAPVPDGEKRLVRLYPVVHADVDVVADLVRDAMGDTGRQNRWWESSATTAQRPRIRVDGRSRTLIVSATQREHDEIGGIVAGVDQGGDIAADQQTQVIAMEFAQAGDVAETLRRFLADQARAQRAPEPTATIVASDSANTLLLSGTPTDIAMLRDLLSKLDQPSSAGDRVIEILTLRDGRAQEVARLVGEQFSKRSSGGQGVVITADMRTNSILVNAPTALFPQVKALVDRLDAPSESDVTVIRTYALTNARADEAVRILSQTLQLDAGGRTSGITIKLDEADSTPVEVKAKIVADKRSNSLLVTATPESFGVVESLIRKLEDVPPSSPVEYRVIALKHALAPDVTYTLRQLLPETDEPGQPAPRIDYNRLENQLVISATADQFAQIHTILKEIDQPSATKRLTDFVPLQFAEAEKVREALSFFYGQFATEADTPAKQNVRIIADTASNSLVISADESEWEGIRGLLAKLDREEYDASLQLRVMPLKYADARSVARAINEAFQGGAARGAQPAPEPEAKQDEKPDEKKPDASPPTQLVKSNEWVSAAAEPQSNAVIISANVQNVRKIEQIIAQIDIPESEKLPPPQFIPVVSGSPVQLANSLKTLFAPQGDERAGRGVRIVGDVATNTLIVRAEDEEFAQIKALAEALQQQAMAQGLSVHVLKLTSAPAGRIASAVRDAFAAKARQANLPLSITVDAGGNSLVVASTGPIYEEIRRTVEQMDALAPAPNQGVFIIDLQNVSPEAAKSMIETIGLDKPQPETSTSRIVSEPIKVSVMEGRNSLVIVASPGDREMIVSLLKALDSEPKMAEAQVRLLRLKNSRASALASVLNAMLTPDVGAGASSSRSRALREQIRRLNVRRDGANEPDFTLDLTKPVRIQPDDGINALIVSSTPENVASIELAVALLDQLPLTDAVTVQIFPLENIAATEFARIVRELYVQGKQLGTIPGLNIRAVPVGTVGKALLEEVAVSVDERTNTVVVAGKEESVAFIQVLRDKLDSGAVAGWIEPRIIPLRFADAADLAETLNEIVVRGTTTLPQASPIQKQVGRLRMARQNGAEGQIVEADVFRPMTQLVIRPEPQLNSLVVVGTPANLDVVGELVAMLDVEAAAPGNAVRIYPVENASAAKLAVTVQRLFDQQVQSKAIRPEDKVFAQADERTNALIVTTSPRSFAVLEQLLKTLDSKLAPELREIRTIELKNAAAARLAVIIQQMMDARMERLRQVQPETAALERAVIVADARSNSLIVAAGNDSFDVIQRLAADLDQSQPLDASQVAVIPMVRGNVDRISRAVNEILQRRYADMPADMSKAMRPLVLTDARTNSLIVAASPEDQRTVAELVTKLEGVQTDPAVGIHVIPLKGARAESLAPRLQALMRERRATLGESAAPSDQVSIQPDTAGNTLIVAASEENAEIVRGLIEALGRAEAEAIGGQTVEIVTLTTSKAAEIVPLVEEMYVNEENRKRGAGSVRATADPRLNAVLIAGEPGDIQTLRSIIGQLDGASAAAVVEIKYIPLTSANALETVGLIENVLAGRNLAGRRLSQQSTVMKYLKEYTDDQGPGQSEMEVSTAIRETINLTPDLRTNTIIVSAPKEAMSMIERMIRDLDGSNIGAQRLRIFKLTNADAEATSEILRELFNLRRQGNLMVLKPREDGPAPEGAPADGGTFAGLSGTDLTAVPDERQQLSITVDSRTNSLLVSATPNYLDLVEKVVNELDAQQANERETLVYKLKNAVASEVADVVSRFVSGDQQKLIETLSVDQLPSASRLLEREVTIVGDEKSNTVLVNASPRYMEQVKSMIAELDVDPPQVLIQVLLAEVTLDTQDEWGVDFNFVSRLGSTTISGGYGLASAVTSIGAPNLAVGGEDFNFLLKAMQSQGRLNVLSNPSIMTANNEEASIQIGETVRLPESTSFEQGAQQSSVVPEDIGVILKVTPSINPEGFVRMDIEPEISSLSQRTTQISENFESPIITRRKANTTVTVKDGQTVVIGGLISNRYEKRDRKVPVLGDVPFLGALFRSEVTETANTELLIVLTPHVVMSPAELRVEEMRQLTEDEIGRLSLPAEIKEEIRRGVLQGTGGLYDSKGRKIPLAPSQQAQDVDSSSKVPEADQPESGAPPQAP